MIAPIVSTDWLGEHLENVVVVHVGTTMTGNDPSAVYVDRHLPAARYISLEDDLAGPAAPAAGRHPLPEPRAFAESMASIGVDTDDTVVAYDEHGGAFAGRLVWMLRIIGQDAALLDGGLTAWDGTVETGSVESGRVERTPVEWPSDAIADSSDVLAHGGAGGLVIDSREAARYRGETEPIDDVAGHIPGAVNVPFAGNLVDGRFRPANELADRFAVVAAADESVATIVYCGSGVTACHNALAIEAAGLPRPRVYVGSWSGWSTEPHLPVATGND